MPPALLPLSKQPIRWARVASGTSAQREGVQRVLMSLPKIIRENVDRCRRRDVVTRLEVDRGHSQPVERDQVSHG
jgi:hypothetical protein